MKDSVPLIGLADTPKVVKCHLSGNHLVTSATLRSIFDIIVTLFHKLKCFTMILSERNHAMTDFAGKGCNKTQIWKVKTFWFILHLVWFPKKRENAVSENYSIKALDGSSLLTNWKFGATRGIFIVKWLLYCARTISHSSAIAKYWRWDRIRNIMQNWGIQRSAEESII